MSEPRLPAQQLAYIASQHPDTVFFRQPVDGNWHTMTYGEAWQTVQALAAGLSGINICPGDRVAIFAKNSQEWMLCDWAIGLAGAISVPIFPSADRDTIAYIMQHSAAKAAFVGKLDNAASYEGVFAPDVATISFPYPTIACQYQWQQLLNNSHTVEFPARSLSDVMTIIYTSGSTGVPKGVVHTFQSYINGCHNFLLNFTSALSLDNERVLSYLPLAHITERVLGEGLCLYAAEYQAKIEVSFSESLAQFADNLRDTAPTLFVSVPRLWQKFQSGVLAKMPQKKLDTLLRIPLLSSLIKYKIKKALGFHKAKVFASGSAPIAPSLLDWYMQIGVDICQGWGMTETNAVGTTQLPFRADKATSIGRPLANTELRISDEGELQIKTSAIMQGYYQQDALNAECFTEDGFFKTGDQAKIDDEGYVFIVGRLKDIFKTAKGKYVAPAPIEAMLARSVLIEQTCVVGTELAQPVALVVLSDHAKAMAKQDVIDELLALLHDVNPQLEKHEKLDGIRVLHDSWTTDNGLITPTLKIRRHAIENHYQALFAEALIDKVVWH